MVQQQPTVSHNDQPTIAIITVNYYEKLAVDAMMSNKITFVRHKPEGIELIRITLYFFRISSRVTYFCSEKK